VEGYWQEGEYHATVNERSEWSLILSLTTHSNQVLPDTYLFMNWVQFLNEAAGDDSMESFSCTLKVTPESNKLITENILTVAGYQGTNKLSSSGGVISKLNLDEVTETFYPWYVDKVASDIDIQNKLVKCSMHRFFVTNFSNFDLKLGVEHPFHAGFKVYSSASSDTPVAAGF